MASSFSCWFAFINAFCSYFLSASTSLWLSVSYGKNWCYLCSTISLTKSRAQDSESWFSSYRSNPLNQVFFITKKIDIRVNVTFRSQTAYKSWLSYGWENGKWRNYRAAVFKVKYWTGGSFLIFRYEPGFLFCFNMTTKFFVSIRPPDFCGVSI